MSAGPRAAGPVYAPPMTRRIRQITAAAIAATFLLASAAIAAPRAVIGLEDRAAPVMFAAGEIEAVLRQHKYKVERTEEWRVDEAIHADLVVRFAVVTPSDDPQFARLAPEG